MLPREKWRTLFVTLLTFVECFCQGENVKDFQIVNNGPTELKLMWTSDLLPDPARQLRIMLNGVLNPDVNKPLDETQAECILDNLEPNTEYTVEVKNCPLGETDANQCWQASESKTSFTNPKAPDTFTIESISNDSIKVSWDTPEQNFEWLSVYAVVWNGNSVHNEYTDAYAGKADVTVRNLSPTMLYNVTVVITNKQTNLSDTCQQVYLVEIPQKLKDFQVINNGPTELKLMWTSDLLPDPARQLRVMLNGVLNPDVNRPLDETAAECILGNLEPNTEYTVEVKNCPLGETDANQCWQASESKKCFTNPKAPDTFTTKAVSNDSIEVSWETPNQKFEGLSVYAVVWNGNSVQHASADANAQKATVIVKNLNSTTLYNVTLVITNERTNLSDTCRKVSVVETPPNLRDFQIVNNGPTELKLTWTSHLLPDPDRELRVMVNDVLNPDIRRRLDETPADCTIGGLKPNTEYTIEIKNCPLEETVAKQCVQASESKTSFTNPKAPNTFTTRAVSSDSIEVSWETPTQNVEGLSVYAVVWNGNSVHHAFTSASVRTSTVTVSNLNAMTLYNVTVVTANKRTNLADRCPKVSVVETPPNHPDKLSVGEFVGIIIGVLILLLLIVLIILVLCRRCKKTGGQDLISVGSSYLASEI
ncbi:hypothetical protein SprV_0802562700 [Sparganum proliferum]